MARLIVGGAGLVAILTLEYRSKKNIRVQEMAGPSEIMEEVEYGFFSDYYILMIEEMHQERLLSNWYYCQNSMGRCVHWHYMLI